MELDRKSQPKAVIQGLGDIAGIGVSRQIKAQFLFVLSTTSSGAVCYEFKDRKFRGQFVATTDQPTRITTSESALPAKQFVILGGARFFYPDSMVVHQPRLRAVTGPGDYNQLWTLDDSGTIDFVPRRKNGRVVWENASPTFNVPGAQMMTLGHSDDLWIIATPTGEPSRLVLWQNGQAFRGSFTGYPFERLSRIVVRDSILYAIEDNKLLWFAPDINSQTLRWGVYAEFPFALRDIAFADRQTTSL